MSLKLIPEHTWAYQDRWAGYAPQENLAVGKNMVNIIYLFLQ